LFKSVIDLVCHFGGGEVTQVTHQRLKEI